MNIPAVNEAALPLYEPDEEALYSLDIVAQLTGVSTASIIHYQQQGFIRTFSAASETTSGFDDQALRTLRRIEHLRSTCGVNEAGLKLILDLIDEVERLQSALRARR
jgi:MerR family transcriptional regulator/heat shock protein HspR